MISYLVRNLSKGHLQGMKCDTRIEAHKLAQKYANLHKTPYTVFKVIEEQHGTYRPGGDYG